MSKQPINGIDNYTHFILDVYMPEGQERCELCPLCKKDNDTDTRRCKFTWEYLPNYKSMIGLNCLLKKEVHK